MDTGMRPDGTFPTIEDFATPSASESAALADQSELAAEEAVAEEQPAPKAKKSKAKADAK